MADDALVERRQIEHAQIAAEIAHILDDLGSAGLAQGEVVGVLLVFLGQLQEGLHDEGVVLGGDGEALGLVAPISATGIALGHEVGLLHHLPRVAEQLHAVARERDAAVGALEDGDAGLALDVAHGH